jgi:hypothetical protein
MGASYTLGKGRLIIGTRSLACIDEDVLAKIQKAYSFSYNRLIIIDHEVR